MGAETTRRMFQTNGSMIRLATDRIGSDRRRSPFPARLEKQHLAASAPVEREQMAISRRDSLIRAAISAFATYTRSICRPTLQGNNFSPAAHAAAPLVLYCLARFCRRAN